MLARLYAGEIIMGRITEDNVPAKLKARVHKYPPTRATDDRREQAQQQAMWPRPAALRLL